MCVLEGPLYAVGGHDGWSYLNTVERWDSNAKQWSYVASMSMPRSTVGVTVLLNKYEKYYNIINIFNSVELCSNIGNYNLYNIVYQNLCCGACDCSSCFIDNSLANFLQCIFIYLMGIYNIVYKYLFLLPFI